MAMATPPGRGAVSVVRLSGPAARELLEKHFFSRQLSLPSRRVVLGSFRDATGVPLDQVLATWFPAPHSYTGEDVVELSCHGSPLITSQIIEVLTRGGARLAEPGEFTKRAFLNGKLDLAQAEAVRDVVESQTAFQARVAALQLGGSLAKELAPVKDGLIHAICQLETSLEFVEDEVDVEDHGRLLGQLEEVALDLKRLAGTFRVGRVLKEGLQVVICGKPNTGKSSIFNCLVGESRAIVTTIPGTTRDALSETVDFGGVPVRLVDTAGIRRAEDELELLGVEKSRQYLREADVVVCVVDGSNALDEEDHEIWCSLGEARRVLVVNKTDLPGVAVIPEQMMAGCVSRLSTCALSGAGMEELRERILEVSMPGETIERDSFYVTNLRHKECLDRSAGHLESARKSFKAGASEEFVLYDLRKTLGSLGEITGETTVEDLLGEIFSSFCIGK